jgi:hypothetical protein
VTLCDVVIIDRDTIRHKLIRFTKVIGHVGLSYGVVFMALGIWIEVAHILTCHAGFKV